MTFYGDKLWHHIDRPITPIKLPLLWDFCDFSNAPFLHRCAWWTFIPHALGTEFLIVFPISKGFDENQLPISSAIKFKLSIPLALNNPLRTEYANYESSVGCPGSRWCLPPPVILKALAILAGVMSLSNSRCAPITSPSTDPYNPPRI